jgi:hypothetical protein
MGFPSNPTTINEGANRGEVTRVLGAMYSAPGAGCVDFVTVTGGRICAETAVTTVSTTARKRSLNGVMNLRTKKHCKRDKPGRIDKSCS